MSCGSCFLCLLPTPLQSRKKQIFGFPFCFPLLAAQFHRQDPVHGQLFKLTSQINSICPIFTTFFHVCGDDRAGGCRAAGGEGKQRFLGCCVLLAGLAARGCRVWWWRWPPRGPSWCLALAGFSHFSSTSFSQPSSSFISYEISK